MVFINNIKFRQNNILHFKVQIKQVFYEINQQHLKTHIRTILSYPKKVKVRKYIVAISRTNTKMIKF